MNFLNLIERKRDGGELSPGEITAFVYGFTADAIPDYQMAAFLMAVNCRGMTPTETRALMLAMRDSGEVLQFPEDARPIVDKHSTGGVGDKVSLVLAPLLACLGCRVPMISGRGLGITGGTLDKLESIPGFSTALTNEQIVSQVQSIGVAMGGQSETIAPADRRLYALRDVTGTVPSIPLITASILSKKLAENLDALVMDVKFGVAAFMQTKDEARALADSITVLANECGVQTTAILSPMDVPLGRAIGNWLEVREAVDCLSGAGPEDLRELVLNCAAALPGVDQAAALAALDDGRARVKFDELLTAQGTDMPAFEAKLKEEVTAPAMAELRASSSGTATSCDARLIGELVRDLGGGRQTKESVIQPEVGVDRLAKPGELIEEGAVLGRIHARTAAEAEAEKERLAKAVTVQ
jgi:pyrimidine-nucleoside phosphorylase